MNIIQEKDLRDYWPIKSFREAYKDMLEGNIRNCFGLVSGDANEDFDKTAVILVRIFIENSEQAKKDQKYIMGLRFYNFGDMATMDIVSFNNPSHRDIVREHASRMHWHSSFMGAEEAYGMPLLVTGAHLQITAEGEFSALGDSCDFGNNLLGLDLNKVIKQIAFLCGLGKKNDKPGEKFLKELLFFMLRNKKRPDFYEKFVENYIAGGMTGQNFASLLMMKTIDRKLTERGSFLEILVKEATNGFASKCLLIGVANRTKK